jgi:hypothetical protein
MRQRNEKEGFHEISDISWFEKITSDEKSTKTRKIMRKLFPMNLN